MKRFLLAIAALFASVASASAACVSPAVMHDFPGTSFNMSLATNAGDGNCASNVGIIGTLPPFAAPPTFNLGTLNGASTAANQTSQITQETAIATATGTVTDSPTAAPATGASATVVALLKGILNTQGSGGGGGATTIVNGGDTTQGATTDAVCATPASASPCTTISLLKAINNNVTGPIPAGTFVIGKVGIDQTTPGTTNLVQMPTTTNAGAPTVKGGTAVVNGGSTYNHVAASVTAQALSGGSGGATGDYLSHCVIYPSTTAAGSVTVFDNTNAAANNVIEFVTGTLSNLSPIAIPVGAVSVNGAWKVTTGAAETVACFGKFT